MTTYRGPTISTLSTVTADSALEDTLPFKITKIALYSIMLFLSILGNGMVTLTASRTRRPRIPSHLLILNLALCDLITPLTSIPFDLALEENNYTWPYGRFLCKVLWPAATLSATSASLTLAAISFDRYRVIMHPYSPRLTTKQVKTMIICLHTFSCLVVVPYAYFLELHGTSCKEMWPPTFEFRKAYTLLLFLVQYGLPLPVMLFIYALALQKLCSSSKKVRNCVMSEGKGTRQEKTICQDPKRESVSRVISHRERKLRATKMFLTVVFVFTTCMLPNQIYWLWVDFGSGYESKNYTMAGIVCRMFTYANSVLNPMIYAIFRKEFKTGFRRQICSISGLFSRRNDSRNYDSRSPVFEKREGDRYGKKQPRQTAQGWMSNTSSTRNTPLAESIFEGPEKRTSIIEEKQGISVHKGTKNHQPNIPSINEGCWQNESNLKESILTSIDEGVFAKMSMFKETDC